MMRLPRWLLRRLDAKAARLMQRAPDKVIGSDYLSRWHVLPKNPLLNVYLHRVTADDPDTHLHDHPWLFNSSVILRGRIIEHLPRRQRQLAKGSVTARLGPARHRLQLAEKEALSLFITGPRIRRWGFYTDGGWVDSDRYLAKHGDGRQVAVEIVEHEG